MFSRRTKEQLNHAMSNAVVRKMESFGASKIRQHAKGDQGGRHDIGPIRRNAWNRPTTGQVGRAHPVP